MIEDPEDATALLSEIELCVVKRLTEATPDIVGKPGLRSVAENTVLLLVNARDLGVVKLGKEVRVRVVPDPDRKLVTVKAVGIVYAVGKPAAETFAGTEVDPAWFGTTAEAMTVPEDDAIVGGEAPEASAASADEVGAIVKVPEGIYRVV